MKRFQNIVLWAENDEIKDGEKNQVSSVNWITAEMHDTKNDRRRFVDEIHESTSP